MMLQLLVNQTTRIALTLTEKTQIQPSDTLEFFLTREQNNLIYQATASVLDVNLRSVILNISLESFVTVGDYIYSVYFGTELLEKGKARVYTNAENEIIFNAATTNETIFE